MGVKVNSLELLADSGSIIASKKVIYTHLLKQIIRLCLVISDARYRYSFMAILLIQWHNISNVIVIICIFIMKKHSEVSFTNDNHEIVGDLFCSNYIMNAIAMRYKCWLVKRKTVFLVLNLNVYERFYSSDKAMFLNKKGGNSSNGQSYEVWVGCLFGLGHRMNRKRATVLWFHEQRWIVYSSCQD